MEAGDGAAAPVMMATSQTEALKSASHFGANGKILVNF
jgi:hypothetical protein